MTWPPGGPQAPRKVLLRRRLVFLQDYLELQASSCQLGAHPRGRGLLHLMIPPTVCLATCLRSLTLGWGPIVPPPGCVFNKNRPLGAVAHHVTRFLPGGVGVGS